MKINFYLCLKTMKICCFTPRTNANPIESRTRNWKPVNGNPIVHCRLSISVRKRIAIAMNDKYSSLRHSHWKQNTHAHALSLLIVAQRAPSDEVLVPEYANSQTCTRTHRPNPLLRCQPMTRDNGKFTRNICLCVEFATVCVCANWIIEKKIFCFLALRVVSDKRNNTEKINPVFNWQFGA